MHAHGIHTHMYVHAYTLKNENKACDVVPIKILKTKNMIYNKSLFLFIRKTSSFLRIWLFLVMSIRVCVG